MMFVVLANFAAIAMPASAAEPPAAATPEVKFSIVSTGGTETLEGFVFSGGSFTKKVAVSYVGVFVRHGEEGFLFDTGLGSRIQQQYEADMPWWARPFFKYDPPVMPIKAQLSADDLNRLRFVVLSHAHWDHASGLTDFPSLDIWVSHPERAFARDSQSKVGGAWSSQVGSPDIRWTEVDFNGAPYMGFGSSHDVFGDGTVILVPMYGHTPGAIGMFLTTTSGKRLLFCGDAVWNVGAIDRVSPKFPPARWLGDHDPDVTLQVIRQLHALRQSDPGLLIVPAHDGEVHRQLGIYPDWVP